MSLTHETLAVIYHNTLFKRMKLETGMSVLNHSISWCWAVDSELKMGEVENGKTIVVHKCAQCRAVEKRSNCKVRCDLHWLFGQKMGQAIGFSYPDAKKNRGVIWRKDTLMEVLEIPKMYIPGAKMIFTQS